RARLAALPPASLRPRYLAENLHVVPIAGVEAVRFDEASQTTQILARDVRGEIARIEQTYVHRAREGCELLLATLHDATRRLCFVAGQVSTAGGGLLIHPITLVFEGGPTRLGLQPWVDSGAAATATASQRGVNNASDGRHHQTGGDVVSRYPADVTDLLG